MKTITIKGTGSALPERQMENEELTNLVDTSDAWIRERTGIARRHIAEEETVVSLAAKAALSALEQAGKKPTEVELILLATCSPEYLLPCSACQVQERIGAVHALAFDINAACSGFLFGLTTANAYLQTGQFRNALVIGSEVLSRLVDWTDRGTCILFGDGAGAVYLEAAQQEHRGFLGSALHADGRKGKVLECGRKALIRMDGQEVYRFAVKQVPLCIEEALEQAGLAVEEIDWFFLHQANIRILEAVAKRLHADSAKFATNLEEVGNMSSASIPVLLDEWNRKGRIQRGQRLVLAGFGAGLTYGACVFIW